MRYYITPDEIYIIGDNIFQCRLREPQKVIPGRIYPVEPYKILDFNWKRIVAIAQPDENHVIGYAVLDKDHKSDLKPPRGT